MRPTRHTSFHTLAASLLITCLPALQPTLLAATPTQPGSTFEPKDRQPTPAELAQLRPIASPEKASALLKDTQFPPGFDVSIFATPPAVNYPVFVAASTDGTVYVSSDGNGSIDRKPHLGRVLRVRDLDGDGKADEVKAFVPDVDSPRGLVWDHDRLYLLHPPHVSVYIDKDGDGVADEERILIRNIAFTFKDRPADHTSNGLTLGIDGWLYAAIGDFGFMEAEGTDGRKLQLHGGGVVRFRPDGTGLELYARGTRNILEVAISPLLDSFARDNTNDGGGWDVRFHQFTGATEHGYPSLFKNFPDEIIPPLADFGGGSGCGAAWIDEPGFPPEWNNAPFTADWGREWVYRHPIKPNGSTYQVDQTPFCKLPRVTDLDVDGNSTLYVASWKGASFTWVGTEVGFLVRARPSNAPVIPMPDFNQLPKPELVRALESPSHRRRLEAQRTLLRKGIDPKTSRQLQHLASTPAKPIASRVAALFTLKQGLGPNANPILSNLAKDPTLAAWALHALTDRTDELAGIATKAILNGLKSTDPRTVREAAVSLGRLGNPQHADALLPLLDQTDPPIHQSAVHSLLRLQADAVCFQALDNPTTSPAVRTGVLQVLQLRHDPSVVHELIKRLATEPNPTRRAGLITALCRLQLREANWTGDSWGTRPDTRGPYYHQESWSESPAIANALKTAFAKADPQESTFIAREFAHHRLPENGTLDSLIARAQTDPALRPSLASQLSQADSIPATAITPLLQTAADPNTPDAARAQAVIALVKSTDAKAWTAALLALPQVLGTQSENNLAERARNALLNSPNLDQVHTTLETVAASLNGTPAHFAEMALLRVAARKIGAPEARDSATKAIDQGWTEPRRRIQIMKAAAEIGDASRAAQIVAAMEDPNPDIAKTARNTAQRLRLDPAKVQAIADAPKVGSFDTATVLNRITDLHGDPRRGSQLFTQIGCNACHTLRPDEPLKGPFLGTITTIYRRRELAEAILQPNKTIAQGFATHHLELKDGTEIEGFVVQEAADLVTLRTITAQEVKVPTSTIARRQKLEKSLMPEGLAATLTLPDFASLLDFLESTPGKQ